MIRRKRRYSSDEELTLSEEFTEARADYSASKSSRFRRRRTGINPMGTGADYHYRSESDYLKLMEYARDMDRNDCIIGQTIDRAVTNIVQNGFRFDPNTGDRKIDADLKARWENWADDPDQCDLAGELCFSEMESLVKRQQLADGDILVLPTEEDSLQLVEAHRLRTPRNTTKNVVHGVLLDDRRRRLEYWLTKDDIDPMMPLAKVSDITAYKARDDDGFKQVFQIYNPKRASQTRGVTSLAPIFDVCGMFEDVQFAKLVQQQVVSCFAVFRKRDLNYRGPADNQQAGSRSEVANADGTTNVLEGIRPGMQIRGEAGETLEGFSPSVPNAEFFPHVRLILTLIGINLGLPLVVMLLDASETNFSGFRGAVDQARMGFRREQQVQAGRFNKQVALWKIRQWMADDAPLRNAAKRAGIDIFRHVWHPPTWPYIEPLKDANARDVRISSAQTSRRRLHAEDGEEWEEIATETVFDNAFAVRLAKKEAIDINKEFPDDDQPVSWRELMPISKATPASVDPVPEPEDEPTPKRDPNAGYGGLPSSIMQRLNGTPTNGAAA